MELRWGHGTLTGGELFLDLRIDRPYHVRLQIERVPIPKSQPIFFKPEIYLTSHLMLSSLTKSTRAIASLPAIASKPRFFTTTPITMGVTKTVSQEGTGAQPTKGQNVTIEYTGYLKDTSKPDNKGSKFDSSVGRGDFRTKIGVGQVIRGWDEGVVTMKVGEKATLDITRYDIALTYHSNRQLLTSSQRLRLRREVNITLYSSTTWKYLAWGEYTDNAAGDSPATFLPTPT
jgi:FK506-binding protein 1